MFPTLRALFRPHRPRWDWTQVEVTTRCDAACVYCPRTACGGGWRDEDMSMALFRRVLVACRGARHLHLQGWGEPLLHPRYPDMLAEAVKAGYVVGLTTNGVHLDAGMAGVLVDAGVDMVALSLAGIGARNDAVRRGAPTARVLAALDALREAKARAGSALPRVHLAYMLLRQDAEGPEALPALLRGRGVETVIVSTLDHVTSPELADAAYAHAEADELAALGRRLEMACAAAEAEGIRMVWRLPLPASPPVHLAVLPATRPADAPPFMPDHSFAPDHPFTPGHKPPELWDLPGDMLCALAAREGDSSCTENVGRAAVITVDGMVAPCVFAALPLCGGRPRDGSGAVAAGRMLFGSVEDAPLSELWRRPAYAAFRAAHARGVPPPPCEGCIKLRVH
ncbi:radical SAM protein [Desulfovibrio oxamicus]|uniref:Radical SAM protein n=1 Tax=Nitratidesulfovibrio oxamicus TaxID=32016 RepID=A0ABS0J972_9BACT|nr:radical SAM/SPASM domain-containing protein [Nitratidesulfovibrio oxamicus]MBG3878491.1 radical SAM protein [Nitratidesulfovibrio oxamicus]